MFSAIKNVGKYVGISSSQAELIDADHVDETLNTEKENMPDEQDTPMVKKPKKSRKSAGDESSLLPNGEVDGDANAPADADIEQESKPKKKKKRNTAERGGSETPLPSLQVAGEGDHEAVTQNSKKGKRSKIDVEEGGAVNGEQEVQEEEHRPVKASKKTKKSKRASLEQESAVDGAETHIEAEVKPTKRQVKAKKVTKHVEEDVPDEVAETTLVEKDAEEMSELINSQLSSYQKTKRPKKTKDVEEKLESNQAAETQDYFEHDRADDSLAPPPEPFNPPSDHRNSTGSSQNDFLAASQLQNSQSPVKESPPPIEVTKRSAASRKRKGKVHEVVEEPEKPKKTKRSKKSISQPENEEPVCVPTEPEVLPESLSDEARLSTEDRQVEGSPDLDAAPPSPVVSPATAKASSWAAINVPQTSISPAASNTSAKVPSIYKATPKSTKKRSIPVDIAELPGSAQPTKRTKSSSTKTQMSTTASKESSKSATKSRPETRSAKGKVSPAEEKLIKAAIETFRDMNNMTDYEVNELIKENGQHGKPHELWEWVNQDLPNRERLSIIRYARRKFHNYPKRGGWNDEEDEELRQVHAKLGNNWKKISDVVQRHPEDVRDRWRNYLICKDKRNNNNWDESEETELRDAVKKYFDIELKHRRQQNRSGAELSLELDEADIQWPKVSEYMGHKRSRLQCSAKWKQLREREAPAPRLLQEVLPPPTNTWRQRKAAEAVSKMRTGDKYILVTSIRDSRAGRESKIPWGKIGDADYREKFSAMILKAAWTKLKNRVDGHDKMPLQEIAERVLDTFQKYDAAKLKETYEGSPQSTKRKYSMPRKEGAAHKRKKGAISDEVVREDDDQEEVDVEAEAEALAKVERKKARKEKRAKMRDRMSRNGESQEEPEVLETQDQPPTPEADVTMTDADWDASSSGRRFREKLTRASQEAAVAKSYDDASFSGDEVSTSTPKKLSSPFTYRKKSSVAAEVDDSDS